jgi:hypothetical protein
MVALGLGTLVYKLGPMSENSGSSISYNCQLFKLKKLRDNHTIIMGVCNDYNDKIKTFPKFDSVLKEYKLCTNLNTFTSDNYKGVKEWVGPSGINQKINLVLNTPYIMLDSTEPINYEKVYLKQMEIISMLPKLSQQYDIGLTKCELYMNSKTRYDFKANHIILSGSVEDYFEIYYSVRFLLLSYFDMVFIRGVNYVYWSTNYINKKPEFIKLVHEPCSLKFRTLLPGTEKNFFLWQNKSYTFLTDLIMIILYPILSVVSKFTHFSNFIPNEYYTASCKRFVSLNGIFFYKQKDFEVLNEFEQFSENKDFYIDLFAWFS